VNDIKDVLGLALDAGPAPGTPADPGADLARGRRLLRRRRLMGVAGVAAAMAVGALVPFALQGSTSPALHSASSRQELGARSVPSQQQWGADSGQTPPPGQRLPVGQTPPVGRAPVHGPSVKQGAGSVKLVAWTGSQPPGYQVNWMPSGWTVQGSTPFALVIAPPGDTDTNPDSFVGKLVVMLQSASVTSQPAGTSQPVDGRPGFFESAAQAGGDTEILTFKNNNGQYVVVQAPMSLGWSSAQLAQFCGGVTVLAAAQQGVG
jgi:hypothetical protein